MLLEDPSVFVLLGMGFIAAITVLIQRGHVIRRRVIEMRRRNDRQRGFGAKLKPH